MGTRLSVIAERLRNSYWFVPTVMMVGAAFLAWVTLNVDDEYDPEKLAWVGQLIYTGGSEGAYEVLGTIAASMITVAGVVFSITIVSLQLASSQFGPRMLANFMRDRGNQITLGTFVSTFLYSLLVLRTVRPNAETAVPHMSVTTALILGVAGLSVLIYFIHHISTTIQAPNLISSIGVELGHATKQMFPDPDEVERVHGAAEQRDDPSLPETFEAGSRLVDAAGTGYVQAIDLERLTSIAREHDLVIRIETRPGRFVVENTPFASAHPSARITDEIAHGIAASLVTGARRTTQQDIEFPIKQMVEIGVRALSPGINDPFTAATCVDQISAGLCEIAARKLPSPYLLDEDEQLRVVHADPVTFERLVGAAYDQLRQCADFHTSVYVHLLESLTRVAACVRDGSRIEPLLREGKLVVEAAERNVEAEEDQEVIEERYDRLLSAAEAARRGAVGSPT